MMEDESVGTQCALDFCRVSLELGLSKNCMSWEMAAVKSFQEYL